MTTRTKIAGAVLGAVVAGALALVPLTDDGPAADGGGDGGGSLAAGPAEKEAVPSFTATDWVSYGDQVAVVRVTAEHELREPDEGADTDGAGTGEDYLARTVDLQVKERVWARSGAPALPSSVSFTADGWQVKDGARKELGSPDSSRLEVGHEYVVTLARFSGGVWSPLGSGGVLPYDHGRVGEGEFEGRTVTSEAYRSAWEARAVPGEEPPVASRTAGKPSSAVREVLRGARPDATAARYPGLDPVTRYRKAAGGASEPAETFCSVAAPLAVSEDGRYTPEELAAVLTGLAALAGRDAAPLRAYAASLTAGDGTAAAVDDTAREASVARIERECGTDVGELLPTDM
ncbi:hypothetical protein AB0G87_29730 [Streptomyces asoensis]|uniref:hypothetical protein n=1 Tax=Streptomyces asoensis TaxID=249586 RepID=UPI0033E239D6